MSKQLESVENIKSLLDNFLENTMSTVAAEKQRYAKEEKKLVTNIEEVLQAATAVTSHLKSKVDLLNVDIEEMSNKQQEVAKEIAEKEMRGDQDGIEKLEKELTNVTAKKMALEIRRDTLAKQETNLGAEEKQKIVAAIHNFGAIKFNSTLVHDRVKTLESLIKQLTTYKEQLSRESDVDLQNFNSKAALQLVSKPLINAIFTEEALKYTNETRQMNAHDYLGVQFVAMWLDDEENNTFTEFCRKYHKIVTDPLGEKVYYVHTNISHNSNRYRPGNILTIYDLKDFTPEGIERLVECGALSSEKY